MSPTEVYKIFVSIFPDWKMVSYVNAKQDHNAIILTDEWGQQYFFKHISNDMWIFETMKQYLKDIKERSK
jgi:hypothetical protein